MQQPVWNGITLANKDFNSFVHRPGSYSVSHIIDPLNAQDWLEEFRKTTLRRGRGAREGHFRLSCEESQLNLTNTVAKTKIH